MQPVAVQLLKRVEVAHKGAVEVLNEVEKAVERESKKLEEVSSGRRFDEEAAAELTQLVEALQRTLAHVEEAEGALAEAMAGLEDLTRA
jgi:methyl-accepting chemotaxis protein